ncbi:hypothetical protein MSG28_000519 [Choristoneura fumiferana]|uniref:Uncharacterized protein n=1 Tax=Choristoneura fumiferana TaxID=7141 RepID=A0ACC0K130_CHOFU|nr:hypothetical protein MSG28_000519 [Choristoneura fumiferana]
MNRTHNSNDEDSAREISCHVDGGAGRKQGQQITIDVLEKYRPLFKHLNGKQIARLNLTDDRIVTYIGTHPELNRHQVGIVASKYMKLNPNWSQPKYLNIMNNLLCGVPMTYIRKISDHTFLQLAHQKTASE